MCGTGIGGTQASGERCSSHSTASNTATAHLSDQAADVLQHTSTPSSKPQQRLYEPGSAGLTPTSEFVMQCFSELSVQADQTPCCARFSLQPRVTLQVTETDKTAMRNLPLINKPVNRDHTSICCSKLLTHYRWCPEERSRV